MANRRSSTSAPIQQQVTLQKGDVIEVTSDPARIVALKYDGFRESEPTKKELAKAQLPGSTSTTTNP